MKAFLVDVRNEIVRVVNINAENELHEIYRTLGVECIDIVTRKVGDRWFDIVCDDEGLFREPVKISAIEKNGNPMLVGNLLFAHHDKLGNLTDLSDDDIEYLKGKVGLVFTRQFLGGYPAVYDCSYE